MQKIRAKRNACSSFIHTGLDWSVYFSSISMPLTVSCFSKIQIGFTFLVPAHLGSPVKRVCVCVCVCVCQRCCNKIISLANSIAPVLWPTISSCKALEQRSRSLAWSVNQIYICPGQRAVKRVCVCVHTSGHASICEAFLTGSPCWLWGVMRLSFNFWFQCCIYVLF